MRLFGSICVAPKCWAPIACGSASFLPNPAASNTDHRRTRRLWCARLQATGCAVTFGTGLVQYPGFLDPLDHDENLLCGLLCLYCAHAAPRGGVSRRPSVRCCRLLSLNLTIGLDHSNPAEASPASTRSAKFAGRRAKPSGSPYFSLQPRDGVSELKSAPTCVLFRTPVFPR